MALQRTRLTEMVYAPSSIGSVYANPASTTTFVRGLIVANTDSVIRTVRIDWVPDSTGSVGTASNQTKIFPEITLKANETLFIDFPFAIVMKDTNESIQALADAASKVTMCLLGDTDA